MQSTLDKLRKYKNSQSNTLEKLQKYKQVNTITKTQNVDQMFQQSKASWTKGMVIKQPTTPTQQPTTVKAKTTTSKNTGPQKPESMQMLDSFFKRETKQQPKQQNTNATFTTKAKMKEDYNNKVKGIIGEQAYKEMPKREPETSGLFDQMKKAWKLYISGDKSKGKEWDTWKKKYPEAAKKVMQLEDSNRQYDTAESFLYGAADSATLGLLDKEMKVASKKGYKTPIEQSREQHPIASTVGNITGYLGPGALAEKTAAIVAKPVLKKIASKVGQSAVTGAVSGAGLATTEGVIRGKTPEEIAKDTLLFTAFGAGTNAILSKIFKKIKTGEAITPKETETIKTVAKSNPEILELPEVKRLMLTEKAMSKIELGPSNIKPEPVIEPRKPDFIASERNIARSMEDFKRPLQQQLALPEGRVKTPRETGKESIQMVRKAVNLPNYDSKPVENPFAITKGETKFGNKKSGVKLPSNTDKLSNRIKAQNKANERINSGEYNNIIGQKYDVIKPSGTVTEPNNIYAAAKGTKERPFVEVKGKIVPKIEQMSKEQFDTHYGLDKDLRGLNPVESTKTQRESINKLLDDAGKRIINKVGSNDYKQVADYYVKKYKLPKDIKITRAIKNENKPAQISIIKGENGYKSVTISINPSYSNERVIGAIRHEIEHYIDDVAGYKFIAKNEVKLNPNEPKTTRGMYNQYAKGHHQNYDWFEADYLYKALQEDAKLPKDVQATKPVVANNVQTEISKEIVPEVQTNINPVVSGNNSTVTTENTANAIKAIETESNKPVNPFNKNVRATGENVESGWSKNIRSDENMHDDIRKMLDQDPIQHAVLKDKEVLASAQKRFAKGYEPALQEWRLNLNSFSPDDVPLARMLANEAAKRGDRKTAQMITADIADKLTNSGQYSRAAKLLRKSNPAVFHDFMSRQVKRINEEGQKLYGNKWKDVTLKDKTLKEIYALEFIDEAEQEQMMRNVFDDIAGDLPVTRLEKFDAWRRMAMLLNPKTHIRNVVGNVFMMGARKTSDTVAAGLEKAFRVKSGERTKSFLWSRNKNLVEIVDNDWNTVKNDLINNNRYEIESINVMNHEKPIFKKGLPTKGIEKITGKTFNKGILEMINQFSKDALNAGDIPFLKRAYKDALGQYMNANKMSQVTEAARTYATRRAFEATYKQTNMLSTFLAKAKQNKGVGKLVDAAIPFSKTPTNIIMRSIEYSPAGLIKTLYGVATGKTAASVIEDLSKGLTGTTLTGLGFMLSYMGWARGARNKSSNAENLYKYDGNQSYSINTPLGNYTFDWAQPLSVPLSMGIQISESLKKNNPDAAEAAFRSIAAGGDTIFNMSMLKNVKNMFMNGSVTEGLMGLPIDYIEQAFPTLSGQIARTADSKQRSIYSPSKVGSIVKNVQSKIPFASKGLEPKIDIWGNEIKQSGPVGQFISPGYYAKNTNDKTTKELINLYARTQDTSFLPKTVEGINYKFTKDKITHKLTPREATEFQKLMGKYNYEDMTKKVSSPDWKLMSDEKKMKSIQSIASSNKEKVQKELIDKGIIKLPSNK